MRTGFTEDEYEEKKLHADVFWQNPIDEFSQFLAQK